MLDLADNTCMRQSPRTIASRTSRGFAARSTSLVALALLVLAADAFAQTQPSLTGTWTWTRKSNGCSEQYDFRADGVLAATSRDARSESEYRMAWAPEPNGRYKLTLATTKDNGALDCGDMMGDRTGKRVTVYLLFGQSGRTMILCNTVDGADCLGPLQKQAP